MSAAKRIGIATCFLDNYGACLQAFALQNKIEELGNFQCEIIRYTEPTGYFHKNMKNVVTDSPLYNRFRALFSPKYRENYLCGKVRRSKFEMFRKQYLHFSAKEYPTTEAVYQETFDYDCFVAGSDQIWNPTFYGRCNPVYYLGFVKETVPKISYAPSIGVSDIPEECRDEFRRYLSSFQAISVRESTAVELVNQYAGRDATWVVDPTMLLTGEEWSGYVRENQRKRPYLFCYLFGPQESYKTTIQYFREKTGLDVVIIPFSSRDMDASYSKVYDADPLDFISLIKHAAYVLTDSFHATVFSILFQKDFYTLLRDQDSNTKSMNSRVYSLLKLVGKEDRCIRGGDDAFEISRIEDYAEMLSRLDALRQESLVYLKNSLL